MSAEDSDEPMATEHTSSNGAILPSSTSQEQGAGMVQHRREGVATTCPSSHQLELKDMSGAMQCNRSVGKVL